jgi:threonine aldolase
LSRVQTNLVYFGVTKLTGAKFQDECQKRGLLCEALDPQRVRFVTHNGVTAGDVQSALQICEEVMTA